jgi:chromosomal replication initiation ATPase DnaA
MRQLSLIMQPKLAYNGENFISHAGTQQAEQAVKAMLLDAKFSLVFIAGAARCGKTHYSVKIADQSGQAGFFARLVEGERLAAWLSEGLRLKSDEVLVVDDADLYLSTLKPGDSGPFVSLVEQARVVGAKICLLSSRTLSQFSFDNHVQSRLLAGSLVELGNPAENELPLLLRALSHQRGMRLKERSVNYVTRRVGREISALELYLERLNHLSHITGKGLKFSVVADAV